MTRIEDDLAALAREVRSRAAQVDVDAAFAEVSRARPPRRPWMLGVAAAVVLVALVAGGVALLSDRGDSHLVADGGPTSAPPTAPTTSTAPAREVTFELLVEERATLVPVGTLSYAGNAEDFAEQWAMAAFDDDPPEVDFERWAVVSFTRMTGCGEQLVAFSSGDGVYEPVFDDSQRPDDCAAALWTTTYVVAVDRAGLPERFKMVVDIGGGHSPQRLEVQPTSGSAIRTPAGGSPVPPDGPDLARPEPGREITFEGMGDIRLGQVLDPGSGSPIMVTPYEDGGPCGYWGPPEPSHDGDEPPGGLVDGAETSSPVVADIRVGRSSRYRTASGVGVGTMLSTLERIYGDDLVVDRADGWEHPTDGLLASYQDVAAVRNGDRALTFYLRGDVVEMVKLSSAEGWGDDEGCA